MRKLSRRMIALVVLLVVVAYCGVRFRTGRVTDWSLAPDILPGDVVWYDTFREPLPGDFVRVRSDTDRSGWLIKIYHGFDGSVHYYRDAREPPVVGASPVVGGVVVGLWRGEPRFWVHGQKAAR